MNTNDIRDAIAEAAIAQEHIAYHPRPNEHLTLNQTLNSLSLELDKIRTNLSQKLRDRFKGNPS
ncbi:unnamed protein product [marine sediment metagenome]|uniref:Uncharacterized protein n=1 Tax=marine sediment metagenome TaxID=412755 RepID=X1RN54_9ZZZZ